MIFKTEEGNAYSKLVEAYGRLLDSCGNVWKDICEARVIYAMPIGNRPTYMDSIAKKRGAGDKIREQTIRRHLEKTVTAEWAWQKKQREAQA
jgi:hypothetical protein